MSPTATGAIPTEPIAAPSEEPPLPALPPALALTKAAIASAVTPRAARSVDSIRFIECAKRGLRRFRQNRPLAGQEELALHTVFYASGKSRDAFKSWLATAAAPVLDKEVERIAALPASELSGFITRAENRLEHG